MVPLQTSLTTAPWPPLASLQGRPGEKVNLSCTGVSHPVRWAWAPSFPACKGLSKGRRKILWVSTSGTPTVPPLQPFAGRLRALDPGIRRLELLLSTGDSGTFFCKGRNEDESHTVLHVLGDRANCRTQEPTHGWWKSHPGGPGTWAVGGRREFLSESASCHVSLTWASLPGTLFPQRPRIPSC